MSSAATRCWRVVLPIERTPDLLWSGPFRRSHLLRERLLGIRPLEPTGAAQARGASRRRRTSHDHWQCQLRLRAASDDSWNQLTGLPSSQARCVPTSGLTARRLHAVVIRPTELLWWGLLSECSQGEKRKVSRKRRDRPKGPRPLSHALQGIRGIRFRPIRRRAYRVHRCCHRRY